ncbi:MAG: glycosyltransferase [Halobacteriaceae archaeon]
MAAPTVALAHAPEGAGNATRTIAVAAELRQRGYDVELAGGGPGTLFAELNGFDPYEPAGVDFIDQRADSVVRALADTVPRAARRYADFSSWLRVVEPAVLLADDPFAVAAAERHGVPFVRLDHSTVADFDALAERVGFTLFNGYSLRRADAFCLTTLLPPEQTGRPDLHHVGPVVHVPDPADPHTPDADPVEPFDVLVVPGTYSTGFEDLADDLAADGYDVRLVGGPDWEAVPAMYPVAAAADVVLCTGFSSIAEATVAGTHCVVMPFIDCQRGVADRIEAAGVRGVTVARSLERAGAAVRDPGPAPVVESGTGEVADVLEGALGRTAVREAGAANP